MDDDKVSGCQVCAPAIAKNPRRSACIAWWSRCVGGPGGTVQRRSARLPRPVLRQKCGGMYASRRPRGRRRPQRGAGRACPSSLEPSGGSLALERPRRSSARQLELAQPRRRAALISTAPTWTGAQKPPFRSRPPIAARKPLRLAIRCRAGVWLPAQIGQVPRRVAPLPRRTGRALASAAPARTSCARAVTVRSRHSRRPRSAPGAEKPVGDSALRRKRPSTKQGSFARLRASEVQPGFHRSRRTIGVQTFVDFPGPD